MNYIVFVDSTTLDPIKIEEFKTKQEVDKVINDYLSNKSDKHYLKVYTLRPGKDYLQIKLLEMMLNFPILVLFN